MPWIRTPEAVPDSHHREPCTSAFPVERVGRLLPSRSISRLFTPFICIPACDFPVYASQWVLPPAHARLGTWLLARLCHGGHLRPLNNVRFQGATLIEPDVQISRIRLSDRTSRLHPRRTTPKLHQAHESKEPVQVREWIAPTPTMPDVVLVA
jgi:hypothetical protein